MFVLPFTILVLLVGTKGDVDISDECSESPSQVCPRTNVPEEFPGNADEYAEFCNFIVPFVTCSTEHQRRCYPESPLFEKMQKALLLVNEVCEKDNRLHDVIVRSLPCLKMKIDEITRCPNWPYADMSEAYEKLIVSQGITSATQDDTRCLHSLYEEACTAASSGIYCGQAIKDVVVEIVLRLIHPLQDCSPEITEKFPTIVDVLELELMQKEELENIVKKK